LVRDLSLLKRRYGSTHLEDESQKLPARGPVLLVHVGDEARRLRARARGLDRQQQGWRMEWGQEEKAALAAENQEGEEVEGADSEKGGGAGTRAREGRHRIEKRAELVQVWISDSDETSGHAAEGCQVLARQPVGRNRRVVTPRHCVCLVKGQGAGRGGEKRWREEGREEVASPT